MALRSQLVDGTGRKYSVGVTKDNRLLVSATMVADVVSSGGTTETVDVLPFRQYFTLDGTASGNNDMRANGSSSSPVNYYVTAPNNGDRYITQVSIAVSDAGMTPAKFGAITALTNGCQLYYTSVKYGNVYLHDSIKTNFDLFRAHTGIPCTGGANDPFIMSNVFGNSDAYIINVDLSRFLPPYGVKLHYLSTQQLMFSIRDNITGIDAFNAIAYGFTKLAVAT